MFFNFHNFCLCFDSSSSLPFLIFWKRLSCYYISVGKQTIYRLIFEIWQQRVWQYVELEELFIISNIEGFHARLYVCAADFHRKEGNHRKHKSNTERTVTGMSGVHFRLGKAKNIEFKNSGWARTSLKCTPLMPVTVRSVFDICFIGFPSFLWKSAGHTYNGAWNPSIFEIIKISSSSTYRHTLRYQISKIKRKIV